MTIDFTIVLWYNIYSQGARITVTRELVKDEKRSAATLKNFSKTFEKPLDKSPKI